MAYLLLGALAALFGAQIQGSPLGRTLVAAAMIDDIDDAIGDGGAGIAVIRERRPPERGRLLRGPIHVEVLFGREAVAIGAEELRPIGSTSDANGEAPEPDPDGEAKCRGFSPTRKVSYRS